MEKNIIAIRVHLSNKYKQVYVATWAEWEEYFMRTFQNEEELLAAVLQWSAAKKVNITKQYDEKRTVNTITRTLELRRKEKAKEQERLEAERLEELRRPYYDLLMHPTRVQLGTKTNIAGVEVFQVAYEFDEDVTLTDIEKIKDETGLTARFITFITTAEQETRYIDEYHEGETRINLEQEIKYTYY